MTENNPDYRAELEAGEAEMADRAARIKKAELLAWCAERDEERRTAETATENVTKNVTKNRGQAMSHDMSAGWQRYIAGQINRSEQHVIKLLAEVVGEAMGKEKKAARAEAQAEREAMRKEFEHELLKLRAEFLESQLDQARGVRRPLKVVPPPETMIG